MNRTALRFAQVCIFLLAFYVLTQWGAPQNTRYISQPILVATIVLAALDYMVVGGWDIGLSPQPMVEFIATDGRVFTGRLKRTEQLSATTRRAVIACTEAGRQHLDGDTYTIMDAVTFSSTIVTEPYPNEAELRISRAESGQTSDLIIIDCAGRLARQWQEKALTLHRDLQNVIDQLGVTELFLRTLSNKYGTDLLKSAEDLSKIRQLAGNNIYFIGKGGAGGMPYTPQGGSEF